MSQDFTFQALENVGLIPGRDMTPEAAASKLGYILGRQDLKTLEQKKQVKINMITGSNWTNALRPTSPTFFEKSSSTLWHRGERAPIFCAR